jgi:hypothetical protein
MTILRDVDPVPLLAVAARPLDGCVDDSCCIDPAAGP